MRNTLFALALVAASPAAASTWELGRSGEWTSNLHEIGSRNFCAIDNITLGTGLARIMVDHEGTYGLGLLLDHATPEGPTIRLQVEFRSRTRPSQLWNLHEAEARKTSDGSGSAFITFTFDGTRKTAEFLADFMIYDEMAVLDTEGKPFRRFSLRGSSMALRMLEDCYGKLSY